MSKIQFIYFEGCPKAADQWHELLEATSDLGWNDLEIEKIDTDKDEASAMYKGWGSPAILMGGKDITGYQENSEAHCRYYGGDNDGILPAQTLKKLICEQAIDKS